MGSLVFLNPELLHLCSVALCHDMVIGKLGYWSRQPSGWANGADWELVGYLLSRVLLTLQQPCISIMVYYVMWKRSFIAKKISVSGYCASSLLVTAFNPCNYPALCRIPILHMGKQAQRDWMISLGHMASSPYFKQIVSQTVSSLGHFLKVKGF